MKNVEYQENIAEAGDIIKTKHRISAQEKQNVKIIVPIVKYVLKRDATFCPHDIITREEEWARLMSYVKHQGKETSEVLVQCKTGEDDNNAMKIGLLCRISGFFRSRVNNICKLRVTPIKSVKFSLIDQTQVQDCDHTQIQNLNAIGLTLGKVSDIKYRISDFNRLLLLVEEARNLMLKPPMLFYLPVGSGDRLIIPDIKYIIRLSEQLIDHIVSRNNFRYLRKQGLQLRTITNLNHRYEEIIHLIKEIVGCKRLDSIREVHSVPLEYAPMIVLEPKQLRGILKRKAYFELYYRHDASISISQLRQYQKQGTELIFTSVDIKTLI